MPSSFSRPSAAKVSGDFASPQEFERLLEWVRLGASHARQHAEGVREHYQRLQARGESKVRLSEFNQWRPSPVFTDWEKAGLSLSQSLSLHEPEEQWTVILEDARSHFSAHQIVRLMLAIVSVNDRLDFEARLHDYILVVEDDPWDEELLVRHLRTAKMTQSVLFAQSGAEALELIDDSKRSGWRLTAVFLDLHLRGLGGVGLIKRIRAIQGLENIPVIAMASAQHPVEVEECEKLRVTSYVEKPITAHSLTKAVAHLSASPGGN